MKRRLTLAFLAATALLFSAVPAFALTIDDVLEMVAVGVPDNIIVSTIEGSEEVFNLSAGEIIDLKKKGVSDAVIGALQATAGGGGRSGDAERIDEGRGGEKVRDRGGDEPVRDRRAEDEVRDRGEEEEVRGTDEGARDRRSRIDVAEEEEEEEEEEEGLIRRRRGDDRSGRTKRSVKRTPKELKQAIELVKNNKPLTGTRDLYDFIDGGKHPEFEAKAQYWLGEGLKNMGMDHSAQYWFQKVVKTGPEAGVYFSKSLANMVQISDRTNDPIYLIRSIDKINPDDYPGTVKDDLYYFQGVRDFERQDYTAARRNFSRLGKTNEHYIQARYYIGVIYNEQGKASKAFKTFRDIILGDFRGDVALIEDIKQLAVVNLARIYYASERYDKAVDFYENKIARLGTYYPTAIYEAAWAHFMSEGKENEALGHILTLSSPFFERNWMPEVPMVEALTFYRICEYKEVERVLDGFKAEYGPIQDTLKGMLPEDPKDYTAAQNLYRDLYGTTSKKFRKLPVSLYSHVEADRRFRGPHNRVLQIQAEMERVTAQKQGWKDKAIGKASLSTLEKEHDRYMKLAGIELANRLKGAHDQIADLMGQEALLRFEMVSGEYKKYERNFRNPDLADVDESVEFDFATNYKKIYWPFNNEFWEDELGYIVRAETGDCKE